MTLTLFDSRNYMFVFIFDHGLALLLILTTKTIDFGGSHVLGHCSVRPMFLKTRFFKYLLGNVNWPLHG